MSSSAPSATTTSTMLSSHAKSSSSSRNLAGMLENGFEGESGSGGGGRGQHGARDPRRTSLSANSGRIIIASNHLPLRVKRSPATGEWQFEFDEDALTAQAKDGVPRSHFQEVLYVGGLPVDVEPEEQEVRVRRGKGSTVCQPNLLFPLLLIQPLCAHRAHSSVAVMHACAHKSWPSDHACALSAARRTSPSS